MIACTLPALTDSILPERKRGELAGEVTTDEGAAGSGEGSLDRPIQTWVRNNDKTKARAEEREKNKGG